MNETGTEQEQRLKEKEWSQAFKDLAGAWKDLPIAEEIRKVSDGASPLIFEGGLIFDFRHMSKMKLWRARW